jgi:hypothetical protein
VGRDVSADLVDGLVQVLLVEGAALGPLLAPTHPRRTQLLHLRPRTAQEVLLAVPDARRHQRRDLPRQVLETESRLPLDLLSVVSHPLPQLRPREAVGGVEAAEVADEGSQDDCVLAALRQLLQLSSKLFETEGEEGSVGVEGLAIFEAGCAEESKPELESLGDVLVDAHDHPLIGALDQLK